MQTTISSFQEMSLMPELISAVTDMGFVTPSPIQLQTIPLLLQGKDIIGQAQTGTGKTAAFAIPALQRLDITNRNPQVMVLCPTRELAVQVAEEFKKLAKYMDGLQVLAVYGGSSMDQQLFQLRKGVHVIVGTPGRVQDHISRGTLRLDHIHTAVLDEADEMLNMGFVDEIEEILLKLPTDKQTVFFSATMPEPILMLTRKFQKSPQLVKVVKEELTNTMIEQLYYLVSESEKTELMLRLIEKNQFKLMLAFCNTKQRVDLLVETLQARGIGAEGLHGDMNQALRNSVMSRFRRGVISVLVATDVAARGIDVQDIEGVFNFDVPHDPEYYVHRIGRTGRAGSKGTSFTFVAPYEVNRIKAIERYSGVKLTKGDIPSVTELNEQRDDSTKKELLRLLATKQVALSTQALLDDLLKVNGGDLHTVSQILLQMQLEQLQPQNKFDDTVRFGHHYRAENTSRYNNSSSSYGSNSRYPKPGSGSYSRGSGSDYSPKKSGSYGKSKDNADSSYSRGGYGSGYPKSKSYQQQHTPRDVNRKRK